MRELQQVYPGRAESVAQVRAAAREYFASCGVGAEAVADAVLVLSELASNAVQHTRSGGPHGCFRVRLGQSRGGLRLEVTDAGGHTEPLACPTAGPEALAERGRGLALVDALAAHWHIRGDHRSWTVAAQIPAPAPPAAPGPGGA